MNFYEALVKDFYIDDLKEDIEKHEELNPKLFDGKVLKEDVRNRILEIVKIFLQDLAEDEIKIKVNDIILVGSNVSYNYTKDSDLDIHIIANTEGLNCPDNLYPLLYSAYKSLFNKKMDINFYGIPVEVYVETTNSALVSNGIYSVKSNAWIKFPDMNAIPEVDMSKVDPILQPYLDRYEEVIENPSFDAIDSLITDIYKERQDGLTRSEYDPHALTFKEFRNRGYLDNLKELKNKVLSDELSLSVTDSEKAEVAFPLDEEVEIPHLSSSDMYQYRLQIQQKTGHQPLIFANGRFTINNIKEDEVDAIVHILKQQKFIKDCHKIASGKYDFSKMSFTKIPSRYFTINGTLNIV